MAEGLELRYDRLPVPDHARQEKVFRDEMKAARCIILKHLEQA